MKKIRALVVDDSVVIRRILSDVLSADPAIEVAGHAANGRVALALLDQVQPDVVTLDIEMPDMDGLEVLRQIRTRRARLPIIMFSTLTERGAEATIDSLSLGASDYVTKPSNVGSLELAKERIREQLIPKIKALCHMPVLPRTGAIAPMAPNIYSRPMGLPTSRIEAVVIGTSTGGPNALAEVLPHLPSSFPVPVLIVQHMPPTFTRFLAQRLDSNCQISVREASPGDLVEAGCALIAPGDFHLCVARENSRVRVQTTQAPPENSCRPSVDVLFRSAADLYGGNVLAVVLTGMGQDGLRGCEHLRSIGAHVFAQDEATSVVWGMPGFVARAQLAQKVLPLPLIGPEIVRQVSVYARPRGLNQSRVGDL